MPARGPLTLPHDVSWGPESTVDLDTAGGRQKAYRAIIREGTAEQQEQLLNREVLLELWTVIALPDRMLAATLEQIRVPAGRGRPRTRPDRVMADKGHPSRANRAWLRTRGIAATIPERDDQITHRRKRRERPIRLRRRAAQPPPRP